MKQSRLLLMLLGLFFSFISLSAQAVWDGSVATSFAGGTGTQDDPYLISNGAELAYLSKITKEDGSQTSGKYYKLTDDIILNSDVLDDNLRLNTANITDFKEWIPIGYGNNYNAASDPYSFMGYFDGDNHVISGVYVVNHGNRYAGLFGVCDGGEIHNLAVVDSYVDANDAFGGAVIAAHLLGYSGYSYGMKVYQCYAEGYVSGAENTGIIVGHNGGENALISESYCYGRMVSNYTTGAIAGYCDRASIKNCYSVSLTGVNGTGSVYSGSANNIYYDNTINSQGSYATGKTTTEMQGEEFAQQLGEPFVYAEGSYPYIEGLPRVGEREVIAVAGERIYVGKLTNSLGCNFRFFAEYEDDVLKQAIRGAEPGSTVYIQPKYTRLMTLLKGSITVTADKTGSTLTVNDLDNDIYSFTMPESSVTVTAKFIRDSNVLDIWDGSVATAFAGGNGTRKDPYLIATASQLAYLAQIANNSGSETRDKYYRLTNDILLNANVLTSDYELNNSSATVWTPIGNGVGYYTGFQGDFDGGGHVISGLYFANDDDLAYVGLFGTLAQNAVVHDLSVVDAYINSPQIAGIIAGGLYYSPTLRRCYADGRVTATTGYGFSGLLTGGSGNDASALVEYCYAKGKADNPNAAAGLMAHFHSGTVRNSYVVGNIICNNSSTGAFFGYMPGTPKASRLYYDKTVDPHLTAYDGKDYSTCYGMTTAEMKSQTFADQLGAPFVYAEGKYPYVKGLLAIGDKMSFVESGYQLKVGELAGNRGSTLQFYSVYEHGDVKKSASFIDEGKTVYVLISLSERMLYEERSLLIKNDMTGESVPVNHVSGNVYSFIMPGSSVTATAHFYYDPVAPAEWDGTASNSFADGSGTVEDPYIISSGEELAYLAQITNANGNLTKGKYYSIVRDIELNAEVLTDNFGLNNLDGRTFIQWTPIGNTAENAFQGTLDGNNHVISGAYLSGGYYSGLFGYLNNAVVRNLSLIDSYNTGQNIGMFAYKADSTTVSRVYVEGSAQNSADYSGYDAALLINLLGPKSKVEYCYTKGSVSRGWYNRCGGAGLVYIQDKTAVIRNCFTASGEFRAVYSAQNEDNISHVYGDNDLGEDFATHDTFCAKHTIELQTTDFAKLIGAPFEYVLGNYPYIPGLMKIDENRGWKTPEDPTHGGAGGVWDGETSIVFASGSGTEADPYIINNGAQLSYLAKLTNANGNLTKGRYYRLEADIILNDSLLTENFGLNRTKTHRTCVTIGTDETNKFQGVFDGNFYTISGFFLNDSGNQGFFGYTDNAVIKNLSLLDSYISSTNSALLVYQADSTQLQYCFVEGDAENSNSYSGYSAAMIVNQLGPKSLMEYCYTSGSVGASPYNGRGSLVITMDDSSTVRNCYSAVSGVPAIYNASGNITNVYFDSDLAGSTSYVSDDFRSAATVEMQSIEFADRMGLPYEYELDYYPHIYGLPKINKTGHAEVSKGYSLRMGKLINGSSSTLQFYRTYDSKTKTLKNIIVSGSKVFVEHDTKIYVKVNSTDSRLLSDEGLNVKNDVTGVQIALTKLADDLFIFSMPQNPVTVSARFVIGGFCGNPEVNNGQDVEWLLSDDRKTLTVSGHGEMVAGSWDAHVGNGLTVYLPATVTTIKAGAFAGIINKLQHVYSPVPVGQTLYANDNQVPDADGQGDVKDFGITQNKEVHLAWYTGYNVNMGTIAGVSCGLKFYADDALTTEIPDGYKAIRKNDNTKVYVKAQPGATSILFKNGLTVKAGSSTLTVTQEGDEVFSFLMPKSAVTISAQFSTGGYCGNTTVNNGHNLIWTLDGGELAFQKNSFAQGSDDSMGNNAPWSTLGSSVKSVDLKNVSSIGSNAFTSCTNLVGLELPASPVVMVGDNAFASQMVLIIPAESWDSYQDAGWAAYAEQTAKDKETLTLKDGLRWRTYYSKVGRTLPAGMKAYTVSNIGSANAVMIAPLNYVPAGQAVLIENSAKTASTVEAVTSLESCLLTTDESNLLEWIAEPTAVSAGQGYTLYKDEFIKVSSGTLPAGVAFLPAQGISASRLSIFIDETTGIDGTEITPSESGDLFNLKGQRVDKPTVKGLYLRNGKKVVIK